MSASDDQSSTSPQFTVDFRGWREIHDREGPEAGSNFVQEELDRVANDWAAGLDRPMTTIDQSTEMDSLEGPQDLMIPVPQQVPQGYTTMTNDHRQLSSGMMPSVQGTQASFFDSPNPLVPHITVTDNDAHAATYDSLGPEWFSGSATSTSIASSCNTDSSCCDSRPALPVVLNPREIRVIQWQPPSSVSDNSTQGESLVVESRRGRKGNRARRHKAGRSPSQDPSQQSQESSRGHHLNFPNQDSPPALDSIYRTVICHRSQEWKQGHIHLSPLYKYDKDRAFRPHLDGFAALSRLLGRDVQEWATRHLIVDMDSLPVSLKPDSAITSANRKSSRMRRTVRESHCSEALAGWYLNTLETLKTNMSHERASKLSKMTIEAIMNTEGDIAELLSSENVKTFMTSKWQNHRVQTVEVRPVRPGTATRSDKWNAVVTYTLQVIPHTGGKAPES